MNQVFGDFSLLKKLGSSVFGEVFLAEHRFIKKQYAIKILSETISQDKEFIERFTKDISVLATLDHPSIVKVHTISFAEGRYFLVMDPIVDSEGKVMDLTRFLEIKGKILLESEVETILRQVASALDYAHRVLLDGKPLIHRGIKFGNILLQETERGLKVFVTDFAFSRIIGESKVLKNAIDSVTSSMEDTQSRFLQNYPFLSPEQKNPDKRKGVSIRSDSYAFGVLGYYLITGEFPEGYFEMPSKVALEYKLNWDLVICKCLHKDPCKRPEYLTEALNTLLSTSCSDIASLEILSWEEVEKKVENAMQMKFEFSPDEELISISSEEEIKQVAPEVHNPQPVIKPSEIVRPDYDVDPSLVFQKELNVFHYEPKSTEVKEIEPILTDMVVIPGGLYTRGSDQGSRDEAPKHKVKISSFAIDIHPVTNQQFVRFLEAMGGEKDKDNNDIIRLRNSRIKRVNGKLNIESGYAKHPVVGVTWYGAYAYAKWVGKRLPTEAEWEMAALGTLTDPLFPFGQNIDHTQANFFNSDTTAVMSYPPSGYGLYDLAGNVYEWCNDWYAYNYYETSSQEPEDPQGPPQGVYRVLRGGCWKSLKEDLRCSHRHRNNPGAVMGTYGFRCAAAVSK